MSELFIEFFSEEIPPSLQISARNQFQKILIDKLSEANLKYNNSGWNCTYTHTYI